MNCVILKRANHLETGAISNVGKPRIFVATEVALEDATVGGTVEYGAPRFELANSIGSFPGVKLGHSPIIEILSAAHRVGEMDSPVVAIVDVSERGSDAALGHYRMGFAEQRFADETDPSAGVCCFDCCSESRAARTDDENVVRQRLVFGHLQNSPVVPDPHGAHSNVDVAERDHDEPAP